MRVQLLLTTILTLLLMAASCTSSKHVEFLGFEGCPNTPKLKKVLTEAQPNLEIVDVDLMALSSGDARLGWGAPTILVHGKDLFGVHANKNGSVSCRNWNNGLPSVNDIQRAFKDLP